MPITTTPPEEEIRSRAQLLSAREPTRDDILKARADRPTPNIAPEQEKALKSAYNVASQKGDTSSAQSQAMMMASAITGGQYGKGGFAKGGDFATQEDVSKAANASDMLTAQFAAEMINDPIEGLINNLRGGREGRKKNIFQNYMGELATAGIKDPRAKLRLLNDFKQKVEGHVGEAKTTMFNKMRTQQLLLQDAWKKVEFMNDSKDKGIANEKDLKKAKMDAEKHEMDMKLMSAQISQFNKAVSSSGGGSGTQTSVGTFSATDLDYINRIRVGSAGDSPTEWIEENMGGAAAIKAAKAAWDKFDLLEPDEATALLSRFAVGTDDPAFTQAQSAGFKGSYEQWLDAGSPSKTSKESQPIGGGTSGSMLGHTARTLWDVTSGIVTDPAGLGARFKESGDRAEEALGSIFGQSLIKKRTKFDSVNSNIGEAKNYEELRQSMMNDTGLSKNKVDDLILQAYQEKRGSALWTAPRMTTNMTDIFKELKK